MEKVEVYEADCLGHIWKRGRGCYLASWYTDSSSNDPQQFHDAFTSLAAAKRFLKSDRTLSETGADRVSITNLRFVRVGPTQWRLDAKTTMTYEINEDL